MISINYINNVPEVLQGQICSYLTLEEQRCVITRVSQQFGTIADRFETIYLQLAVDRCPLIQKLKRHAAKYFPGVVDPITALGPRVLLRLTDCTLPSLGYYKGLVNQPLPGFFAYPEGSRYKNSPDSICIQIRVDSSKTSVAKNRLYELPDPYHRTSIETFVNLDLSKECFSFSFYAFEWSQDNPPFYSPQVSQCLFNHHLSVGRFPQREKTVTDYVFRLLSGQPCGLLQDSLFPQILPGPITTKMEEFYGQDSGLEKLTMKNSSRFRPLPGWYNTMLVKKEEASKDTSLKESGKI